MWYGIPLPPYLNTLISVYAAILAYAVVRHQLMDIEVIVKRTIVFAGIVASAVTLISLPLALAQVFIGRALGIPPFWLLSMGIATAVLIYRPIDRILTQITDRYLFQKKINYRILLKEATEYLAHLDSLKRQARRMVAFLLLKARIQNASIYAFQNYAPGSLLLEAARPPIKVSGHKTILFSHPLARYMKEHRGPIELQTIQESRRQERDPSKIEDLDQILKLLNEHKAEAAIPCFGSSASERARRTELHLRGILFLGPQKSDEPYRDEDLDVFFTLGQESSIAFENARLYDEAVHKKRELEEINEKMTQAQNDLIRALHDAETAKKEAEESREEALEAKKRTEEMEVELIRREKLVFVERLVQGLSHEIFNPMASILMEVNRVESIFKRFRKYYHETLSFVSEERKTSIESDFDLYRQSIYLLKRTTDHIMRVVDTLNEMQKPDDQTIKPIDFKGYLATALPVIEAQSHGDVLEEVRIDFEIQHNLPLVNANVAQLTQVFLNLYRNALYAVKDRENKEIKLEAIEDPERQEFLRITFMDNGTGIAPEILPKIFDYMFSTKGDKGHGIGLNMCKVIIERFGGTLSCESELWKGAKFIVRLPFVREATRDQTMEENSAQ